MDVWRYGKKDRVPSKELRERHNLGTTAKQVALIWPCVAKKKTLIG